MSTTQKPNKTVPIIIGIVIFFVILETFVSIVSSMYYEACTEKDVVQSVGYYSTGKRGFIKRYYVTFKDGSTKNFDDETELKVLNGEEPIVGKEFCKRFERKWR